MRRPLLEPKVGLVADAALVPSQQLRRLRKLSCAALRRPTTRRAHHDAVRALVGTSVGPSRRRPPSHQSAALPRPRRLSLACDGARQCSRATAPASRPAHLPARLTHLARPPPTRTPLHPRPAASHTSPSSVSTSTTSIGAPASTTSGSKSEGRCAAPPLPPRLAVRPAQCPSRPPTPSRRSRRAAQPHRRGRPSSRAGRARLEQASALVLALVDLDERGEPLLVRDGSRLQSSASAELHVVLCCAPAPVCTVSRAVVEDKGGSKRSSSGSAGSDGRAPRTSERSLGQDQELHGYSLHSCRAAAVRSSGRKRALAAASPPAARRSLCPRALSWRRAGDAARSTADRESLGVDGTGGARARFARDGPWACAASSTDLGLSRTARDRRLLELAHGTVKLDSFALCSCSSVRPLTFRARAGSLLTLLRLDLALLADWPRLSCRHGTS